MVAYIPPKQAGKYKAVASGAITNGKPVIAHTDGTVKQVQLTAVSQAGGTPVVFNNAGTGYISVAFDSNANKTVVAYINQDGSNDGTARVGTIDTSDDSVSFGTAAEYTTNYGTYVDIAFDSSNNKVVIVYRDNGNSNYGTAVVGTVSGTDITFGTPVVFESATVQETCITFDSSNNKVAIAYLDQGNSGRGTAIVGTVSGTSISFGSAAEFETGGPNWLAITFDSSNNKVVISYNLNSGPSNYSAAGKAIVGTISSTSISFGTAVVFGTEVGSPASAFEKNTSTFDSNSNKVVLAYQDKRGGSGNIGEAIVGTVSGTSISFGTAVAFGASESSIIGATFDSTNNKVVIGYKDSSNSGYATVRVGTVSGTDISFDTAVVIDSINLANNQEPIGVAFDSNVSRTLFAYVDNTNDTGDATVFRTASSTPNITSENYIGIASGGTYADTAEATIDVVGTVNKDQTGLTAGQTYYVQTDGTLGTSADSPSVVAGTAISATELIVKGQRLMMGEISPVIFWNVVLTLVIAPAIWMFRNLMGEVKRIDILLNRTREEYSTKQELREDMKMVTDALHRLEDKLDKVLERGK